MIASLGPWRRFIRATTASSAVEFALVAPIFLVCAFALFQVGFGIYAQATISQVAHTGARFLLFSPEDSDGALLAMQDALTQTALRADRLSVSTEAKSTPFSHIELIVRYSYQPFGPIPLPEDMTLSAVTNIPLDAE